MSSEPELNQEVDEGPLELTQRQLARLLGCSPASVVAWEQEGLPCLGDRGRFRMYDAPAVVQWWLGRELARRGADDPHRQRLVRAQADRAELELAARRGELGDLRAVAKEAFDSARTLREQLLNVPDRVATGIAAEPDPVRVHEALTREIKRVLQEFVESLKRTHGPPAG